MSDNLAEIVTARLPHPFEQGHKAALADIDQEIRFATRMRHKSRRHHFYLDPRQQPKLLKGRADRTS